MNSISLSFYPSSYARQLLPIPTGGSLWKGGAVHSLRSARIPIIISIVAVFAMIVTAITALCTYKKMKASLERRRGEVIDLRNQFGVHRLQSNRIIEGLRQQNEDLGVRVIQLQADNNQQRRELEHDNEELHRMHEERQRLEGAILAQTGRIEALEHRVREETETNQNLRQQTVTLEERIVGLRNEFAAQQEAHTTLQAQQQATIETITTRLAQANREKELAKITSQKEVERLTKSLEELRAAITERADQYRDMEQRLELNAAKLIAAEKDLEQKNEEIARFTARLATKDVEVAAVRKQIQETESLSLERFSGITRLQHELERLRAELETNRSRLAALQAELAETKKSS